jgi:hypothetical protein
MEIVDSGIDRFSRPCCGSSARERHLSTYLDKLELWDDLGDSAILHFAPDRNLAHAISDLQPKADRLLPSWSGSCERRAGYPADRVFECVDRRL